MCVWSGVVRVAPLATVVLEGLSEAVALELECSTGGLGSEQTCY